MNGFCEENLFSRKQKSPGEIIPKKHKVFDLDLNLVLQSEPGSEITSLLSIMNKG
jgi:hypothetical protein